MYEDHPSNSMGAERTIHYQLPSGECAYDHSYPPQTVISSKTRGSASIPIDRESMRKTASEYRMAQDEAEADYKDFVFFSRVVDGISKQNSLLKDGSYLKSTNQTLLDNIVRARHDSDSEEEVEEDNGYHNHYYFPQGLQINTDLKIVTPAQDDPTVLSLSQNYDDDAYYEQDYEDEGVFDLEL